MRLKFEIAADGSATLQNLDGRGAPWRRAPPRSPPSELWIDVARRRDRQRPTCRSRSHRRHLGGNEPPAVAAARRGGPCRGPFRPLEPLTQDAIESMQRGSGAPALTAGADPVQRDLLSRRRSYLLDRQPRSRDLERSEVKIAKRGPSSTSCMNRPLTGQHSRTPRDLPRDNLALRQSGNIQRLVVFRQASEPKALALPASQQLFKRV